MNSQKNNIKGYRDTNTCITLLNELNLAYEKIKNLAGVEKNQFGEYDYPNVAYKVKKIIQNNQSTSVLYCCVADTTMNKKLNIEDILAVVPLYIPGTIRSVPSNTAITDIVYIEGLLNDIQKYVIKYYDSMGEISDIKLCTELIQWMDKFPANSISEVNFNSLVGKDSIESCISTIKEVIENYKEAA